MNEVVLKILAQIALNQGDIPKLIKQLQSEVAKAAGVEIPIKFQKPPSDASIRSLLQRSREEFSLQGIKAPSNTQLLQQLEAQAARQGLFEKFPSEQIRHLGERQLQLEGISQAEKLAKQEETSKFRLAQLEEKLAKQRETNLLRQAQLEEKLSKQKEDREFRTMQIQEKIAKQREDREFRAMQIQEKVARAGLGRSDTSKLLDSVINEMKFKRMPEFEDAARDKRKYEFDPYAPENRSEAMAAARSRLNADPRFVGNAQKTTQAMARFEEQMNLRRMRSLEFLGKTAGQTNMQITQTSNYLLAASSILRPLSPILSNLAMSAGFAAFSLGAVPALLTAATAGLGAWIALLKLGSSETTKAGLATREWKEATFQYNMTVRAFLVTIGRDVQTYFAPTVDLLEQLAHNLNELPLERLIESTARGAETILRLALAAEKLSGPGIELFAHLQDMGFVDPGTKSVNRFLDRLNQWMGVENRTDKDRPSYFPNTQFHIRDVRDVGSSIQQSILKNAVEDQILAETVKANEQREETNRLLREGFRRRINNSMESASRAMLYPFFPWLITADSM